MKLLNEILGTKYPIIQGGMANIATGEFAAACSNAGALGIIGAGGMNADTLRQNIRRCRELTDKPFGVNIMLMHPQADEFAQIVVEEKVAVVTTGAGNPGKYVPMWKAAGIKVIPVVAAAVLARHLEPLGIDAAYTATQLEEPEYLTATYHKDGSLYAAPSYILRQTYDAQATPDTHYRVTVGSLLIRPRDLTRLGIAICGDGTVDGVRVLSEDAIAMMRQEQSEETTGITFDSPYSFFTIRQDTLLEGRRVYGHQGTDEGIVCNLYVEPESQTVFCVMTNGCKTTREDGIMRLTRRLCAIAEEEYLKN